MHSFALLMALMMAVVGCTGGTLGVPTECQALQEEVCEACGARSKACDKTGGISSTLREYLKRTDVNGDVGGLAKGAHQRTARVCNDLLTEIKKARTSDWTLGKEKCSVLEGNIGMIVWGMKRGEYRQMDKWAGKPAFAHDTPEPPKMNALQSGSGGTPGIDPAVACGANATSAVRMAQLRIIEENWQTAWWATEEAQAAIETCQAEDLVTPQLAGLQVEIDMFRPQILRKLGGHPPPIHTSPNYNSPSRSYGGGYWGGSSGSSYGGGSSYRPSARRGSAGSRRSYSGSRGRGK